MYRKPQHLNQPTTCTPPQTPPHHPVTRHHLWKPENTANPNHKQTQNHHDPQPFAYVKLTRGEEMTRIFRALSVGRLTQMAAPKFFSSTNDGTLCISVDAR